MGVITTDLWVADESAPGGIRLETVANADAYGLAVVVENATEQSAVDWTKFHDGTLVINRATRTLYFVNRGVLTAVAV